MHFQKTLEGFLIIRIQLNYSKGLENMQTLIQMLLSLTGHTSKIMAWIRYTTSSALRIISRIRIYWMQGQGVFRLNMSYLVWRKFMDENVNQWMHSLIKFKEVKRNEKISYNSNRLCDCCSSHKDDLYKYDERSWERNAISI